jgi:radical SAM superfamily enzyme YgiQ (UPF0313 family)
MKILLINTNRNKSPMPVVPLGACLVAEATERAGHEVRFLDLMFAGDPLKAIEQALRRFTPDLIGVSLRNIDNNDMLHPVFFAEACLPLLRKIRALTEAPVVLGGAAVSVMPEQLLRFSGADWGVVGEGDAVFPELANALSQGRSPEHLPGLAWFREGEFHLNPPAREGCAGGFTVPRFSRWLNLKAYKRNMATAPLQTKLGCHFQCVYCTYSKIEGGAYRLMSPESTVAAVRAYTAMGFRNVEFVDNVFNSPPGHCLTVCEGLARSNHSARLQTYELNPLFVDDDLLSGMEEAGFVGAGITVESASSKVLARLRKGFSAEVVHRAAETVRRHRLPCLWIFMLGGPGETEETVAETLAFAQTAIRPTDAAFFTTGIRVYPGTELDRIARDQGVLDLSPEQMLEPFFYVSPEVDRKWLAARIRLAMRENFHFLNGDTFDLPFLPTINRLGSMAGIEPPLWRYTRHIRRGLRLAGVEA